MLNQTFTEYLFHNELIKFGEFKLKSGRLSPYFFHLGSIDNAAKLSALGDFYSTAIIDKKIEFDCLFGPAYKGIPISLATALSLYKKGYSNVSFAFNRKEIKDHGEGGKIIGASLKGKKVLAVDDVLTSGKTIRETKQVVESEGGTLNACLVALDRGEKGLNSEISALEEASKKYDVHIYSVASIQDIVHFLENDHIFPREYYQSLKDYLKIYGSQHTAIFQQY
ncbi:orotate phosphoribosyltransferase [Bacillus sp. CLL-7-23]|uniref:Orotate phosphoribosyltransferase n=1 Tax=Bacillus changyiensis TaxID=3004103 RepID=A0ABT4X225_9BACI|nr:orotate phosphoribosyltransferase [Bacillus changyiensis]MDA7026353.1 orotate phosphoribosyltransferase [Bacillus changyiensis]